MPVMQLFIYGYAITFDVNNITTIVYDQDRRQPEQGAGGPV